MASTCICKAEIRLPKRPPLIKGETFIYKCSCGRRIKVKHGIAGGMHIEIGALQ